LSRRRLLFYRNLELPELDKIHIIKDLLCVKYGLVSLPLFDVSQIDFMLYTLYSVAIFTNFLSVLFVRFYITLCLKKRDPDIIDCNFKKD